MSTGVLNALCKPAAQQPELRVAQLMTMPIWHEVKIFVKENQPGIRVNHSEGLPPQAKEPESRKRWTEPKPGCFFWFSKKDSTAQWNYWSRYAGSHADTFPKRNFMPTAGKSLTGWDDKVFQGGFGKGRFYDPPVSNQKPSHSK